LICVFLSLVLGAFSVIVDIFILPFKVFALGCYPLCLGYGIR